MVVRLLKMKSSAQVSSCCLFWSPNETFSNNFYWVHIFQIRFFFCISVCFEFWLLVRVLGSAPIKYCTSQLNTADWVFALSVSQRGNVGRMKEKITQPFKTNSCFVATLRVRVRAHQIPTYHTRAIIGRSRFEAALVSKPRMLGLKNEEFLFLVHKLS